VGRGHALRSARRMSLWEAIVELGGGEGRLGSGGGDAGRGRESKRRTMRLVLELELALELSACLGRGVALGWLAGRRAACRNTTGCT
jgi:hypothetical protein